MSNGVKAFVDDLSRNGTFVNNERLGVETSLPLKAGDILSLIRGHSDKDTASNRPCYAYRGETFENLIWLLTLCC
jgi:hypothetical protein